MEAMSKPPPLGGNKYRRLLIREFVLVLTGIAAPVAIETPGQTTFFTRDLSPFSLTTGVRFGPPAPDAATDRRFSLKIRGSRGIPAICTISRFLGGIMCQVGLPRLCCERNFFVFGFAPRRA
jgi:hypothetical protein